MLSLSVVIYASKQWLSSVILRRYAILSGPNNPLKQTITVIAWEKTNPDNDKAKKLTG
ncbi:MAG TPA: hypothetical protein VIM59_07510 [Cellvibrio sp.]